MGTEQTSHVPCSQEGQTDGLKVFQICPFGSAMGDKKWVERGLRQGDSFKATIRQINKKMSFYLCLDIRMRLHLLNFSLLALRLAGDPSRMYPTSHPKTFMTDFGNLRQDRKVLNEYSSVS